jgi:hypothetical protein
MPTGRGPPGSRKRESEKRAGKRATVIYCNLRCPLFRPGASGSWSPYSFVWGPQFVVGSLPQGSGVNA